MVLSKNIDVYGEFGKFIDDITENNCNGRLERLEKIQTEISNMIDMNSMTGKDTKSLEQKYDMSCNTISVLVEYRRFHDCYIKGDKGYIPCNFRVKI